jgi:Na+/alanine symporter
VLERRIPLDFLNALDSFMWGKYMMAALSITGIVLTIRFRGVQFRKLGYALKLAFSGATLKSKFEGEGDIAPFQALMTTLAATVGNGNIAGVATEIALGGPGAPLGMWITALAIVMTGAWQSGETSTALTTTAFSSVLGTIGGYIVTIGSALFGYSTILGRSYYGEQCTEYLSGSITNIPHRLLFVVATFIGAVAKLSFVWTLSDVLNGFMAIPNLIGLLVLSGVAAKTLNAYLTALATEKA